MPVIEPVPWEHLDAELAGMIQAGLATGMLSTTLPSRIWAYRPELAKEHLRRYSAMFERGTLDPRLLELVRLRVAAFNDCAACAAARKSDAVTEDDVACLASDDPRFSAAERAALRYTELFITDHHSIDPDLIAELGTHFSTPQVIELMIFVASALGGGRMVHVLQAYDWDETVPALPYRGEMTAPAQ
jgi:alkylhydroperoxidase family enzyme